MIPENILVIVSELQSPLDRGHVQEDAWMQLMEIRDYLNDVLGDRQTQVECEKCNAIIPNATYTGG